MIKGIVFDMDGLMFDTERISADGWKFAGKQMGFDITEEILKKTLGLNIQNTRRVLCGELGESFDFPAARKIKVDYMTSYIEKNGIPMKPVIIPDMVQPDEETGKLLYAKLPTLLEVTELVPSQNSSL